MGRILYPPKIIESSTKTIFLAGPIQGADNWQEEAIKIIQQLDSSIDVACPRRPRLARSDFSREDYEAQVDWETRYLREAGSNGVILFWLAKESEHICERAYAQTTRFELGEWKVRHERDGVELVVGIEPGFTNERYIRRRFSQDCPNVPIFSTLQDTCEEAVRMLRQEKVDGPEKSI